VLCRTRLQSILVAVCLVLASGSVLLAAPASERLLPATTKGFLSVGNVDQLRSQWAKTQIGQLMADPIMQPFVEDFRAQLQGKWSQSHHKLGVTWDDLEGVPAGEVAMAMIQPSKTEAAFAMLVDVTGHPKETAALMEKIAKTLAAEQAKKTSADVLGTRLIVFDLPKTDSHPARQAIFCVREELLIASDSMQVVEGILARFGGRSQDTLEALPAFAAVMARCHTAAGDLAPDARWFLEPFGYTEAARAASTERRKKGTDMLKILKNQGFTAIQGLGGYVNLAVGKFELVHRTFVYAPPVKAGEDKYELAANMLDFPNGDNFEPQAWVPREVASYASFDLKPSKMFEASKTLVNEIVGDPVFEDVIESIEKDPNGPQINIRRELIAQLGGRATVLSDYLLPITPKSERMLFAIDVKDAGALAATIEKSMKTDPQAKRHDFNGHVIWEIVNEEAALPMITIENHPSFAPGGEDEEEPEKRMLPNSAVTVAFGQLFVATHYDFLTKVLSTVPERQQLSQSLEYRLVREDLDRLAGNQVCAQVFARTDEEYRAVYELIRTGRMPESETLLGKLLNAVLGEGKEGVPRAQRINGSRLPDFEAVRRYFGPAGLTSTSEAGGWFLTGFALGKETP
jgi:hypothetical protein